MPRNTSSLNGSTLLLLVIVCVLAFVVYRSSQQAPRPEQHRHSAQQRREGNRREEYPHTGKEPDEACSALGLTCGSTYFAPWQPPAPGGCGVVVRAGNVFPDARCTPGGVNPSVTMETLRNPAWRTRCLRNCETSEAQKHIAYSWYAITKPRENSEENQVCELDHLIPLELGGADGMGNLWPECGPADAPLRERNFKIKDRVENYLADEVRAGRIPLAEAQHGIARDWSQYLPAANRYCQEGGRC